jgi:FeS assembly protein IscX
MPADLYWDDAEEIGLQLAEKFPHINPLEVRFPDLQRYVAELPNFRGDPERSEDAKLEGIQAAWNREYQRKRQRRTA